jgi:hypothetical protein
VGLHDFQSTGITFVKWARARSALSQQIIVTTAQRLLQPPNRCGQDIQLPGLNLLDRTRGKVRQFRQLLLREPGGTPLPTKILTDGF